MNPPLLSNPHVVLGLSDLCVTPTFFSLKPQIQLYLLQEANSNYNNIMIPFSVYLMCMILLVWATALYCDLIRPLL